MDVKMIGEALKKLSDSDLRALNTMIVERIRWNNQVKAHEAKRTFSVGSFVQAEGRGGRVIYGMVEKMNQTTLTVRECSPTGVPSFKSWRVPGSIIKAWTPIGI